CIIFSSLLTCYPPQPILHSFPTRRASDLVASGIRYRTRMRAPSAAETLASSRKMTKACPSTPVRTTLAITSDHSPVFSSARSIRSEEHTSELQSPDHLVCRLLLETKEHRI